MKRVKKLSSTRLRKGATQQLLLYWLRERQDILKGLETAKARADSKD